MRVVGDVCTFRPLTVATRLCLSRLSRNTRDAMQGGLGGGTVSMRPGIDAGESYVREVAAYLLVRA